MTGSSFRLELVHGLPAAAAHFAELRELRLCNTHLGLSGANALVACARHWPLLTRLDLGECGVTHQGVLALTAVPGDEWSQLRTMWVEGNPLGPESKAALQQRWPSCRLIV